MTKAAGGWLTGALALEARISGKGVGDRRTAYDDERARRGLSLQTLRRMVAAARYVRSTAKSVGLEVQDVRAAVVSVEALMRLEKRDPRHAAALRGGVLKGETSFRALLAALDGERRPPQVATTADWASFALTLADQLYTSPIDEVGYAGDRSGLSAIAREIKVDLEVRQGGMATAVFLAPGCGHSEFAGRDLSEQVPRVFMALAFYPHVVFAYRHDGEGRELDRLCQEAGAGAERLRLFDLATAFGS